MLDFQPIALGPASLFCHGTEVQLLANHLANDTDTEEIYALDVDLP
jgi:hypothetical protein